MLINKILPAIKTNSVSLVNPVKKFAPYVLGFGLLLSSGAVKANDLKTDIFENENIELTEQKSQPDKHLLGELIFGAGLLTYIGIGLYSALNKNKDDNTANKKASV